VPADERVRAAFDSLPAARLRAALIGSGIQESRTPWMHMAEGARLGLDYSYALIDFDALGLPASSLKAVLNEAAARGFAGLNITHPFKQSVIPHLDVLSPESAAIGAVNTIVFAGDRTVGHNTDCWGFAESFRAQMQGADLGRVLVLGAGGAGRAVAHSLRELGASEIEIFDLDPQPATDLAATLNAAPGPLRASVTHDIVVAAASATGIVNATPVGMAKYPGMPVPASALRPDLWVADVIYFPAETELLRSALAAGSRTMSGGGMAVFQAVKAFELLTGRRPDVRSMFWHFDSIPQNAPAGGHRLT